MTHLFSEVAVNITRMWGTKLLGTHKIVQSRTMNELATSAASLSCRAVQSIVKSVAYYVPVPFMRRSTFAPKDLRKVHGFRTAGNLIAAGDYRRKAALQVPCRAAGTTVEEFRFWRRVEGSTLIRRLWTPCAVHHSDRSAPPLAWLSATGWGFGLSLPVPKQMQPDFEFPPRNRPEIAASEFVRAIAGIA